MYITIAEAFGWAARIWSTQCPYNLNAFLMQFSTLIIGKQCHSPYKTYQKITKNSAPTFFSAAIYIFLGCFVRIVGRASSYLGPKSYLWTFGICDIISIVIQGVGGGIASADSKKIDGTLDNGTHIMLAGVVFQLFSMAIFMICACDVFYRVYCHDLPVPSGSANLWLGVLVSTTTCIFIRCIYRTVELGQGPGGYLLLHESYLISFDAVMMVLLVAIFAIFHPGWLVSKKEFIPLCEVQLLDRESRL